MSGKAAKIQITEKQHRILQQVDRSATAPKRLSQRASVILMSFAGMLNVTIARELGLARKQVGLWRLRWQQSFDALVAIECCENQAALRRAIEDVLSDAPRSGSTGTFTAATTSIVRLPHRFAGPTRDGRRLLRRSNAPLLGRKAGQADERIVKLWPSWANNCESRHDSYG